MVETIVVTRHPALRELLVERGIISPDTPVISHASPDDIRNRHVIGVLPLSLAALAESVTEIPLRLTEEMRGRELSIDDLRNIAGDVVTYRVTRVED